MAVGNGEASGREGEQTPLLREERRAGDDGTREGLMGVRREVVTDSNNKNRQVGKRRGFLISLSLWALIFLQATNTSGITTTQSRIAEDLDAFSEASWFTSAYLIAMSSFSPIIARLAQIFSPRYCILVASMFFSLGAIVTSQAPSLEIFLLGRVFGGIGAGGILTVSFILVLELSGKKRRGLFIGLVNTAYTLGVAFGAVIAGALLHVTGWRFLFWIQSPVALVAGLGIFFSIPKPFTSGQKGAEDTSVLSKLARIDYLGAVTLIAALVSFLLGLSFPKVLWQPIALSFVLLIVFIVTETYVASEPIIPVTVLKSRGTLLSCLAELGTMSARWMVLFYSPVYAIAVRGWSPASAGSVLIPTNLGFAVGGLLVGWLHVKRAGSFWLAAVLAYFFFSCTILLLSQVSNAEAPASLYLLAVFLNGVSAGAVLSYALAHLLHLTPPSTHYISTSLLTTFRGFAGSFGSAIGGGLFIRVLKGGLEEGFEEHGGLAGREDLVRRLLGSPALVKNLHESEKTIAIQGYARGLSQLLLTAAGLSFLMVIAQAATGWASGARKAEEQDGDELVADIEDEDWEEGMEQGV